MTSPDITETDDTAPVDSNAPLSEADPGTSPVVPAPAPPGDFGTSSVWTSPSTYITAISYLLPILSTIFHKDFTQYAQAISQAAPIVATAILLVARNLHKREVIRANAQLAVERLGHTEQAKREAAQIAAGLQREVTLALVSKLTAAEAKKYLTTNATLSSPVAA